MKSEDKIMPKKKKKKEKEAKENKKHNISSRQVE